MSYAVTDQDHENPDRKMGRKPKIGIALGAGGAKGVAHVPMLEALDELGITPARIAGCSIGAVFGAMYASGLSAEEIKNKIKQLMVKKGRAIRDAFSQRKIFKWVEMIDPDFRNSGLIKSESIMAALCEEGSCSSFEELQIPLTVAATDFWKGRTVVFDSGPLKPAIQASMALPGLFAPVSNNGQVLIDGGTVNPVPYDLLFDSCDIVIAIDINSGSAADEHTVPGYFNTMFGAIQIMQQAIVERQLQIQPPTIYINPDLSGIRTLHFNKAEEIYEQSQAAKQELKTRLLAEIEKWTTAPSGGLKDR